MQPSDEAAWLVPCVEALTAISASIAPVEHKIRSSCRVILDHVGALGVWVMGWGPGQDPGTQAQVLGSEVDDDTLYALIKSKNQGPYVSWLRRLMIFAEIGLESQETAIESSFLFEGQRYVLACSPLFSHGKALGFLFVVTDVSDVRESTEWSQLRVLSRVLCMSIRSSLEYQMIGVADVETVRLKALSKSLPGSVAVLNENGLIVRVFHGNKPVPHLSERNGHWYFLFSATNQLREHEKALSMALSGVQSKCFLYIKGEKHMVMEHTFEPIRVSNGGKVREVVCFAREITETIRLKSEIKNLKERDVGSDFLSFAGISNQASKEMALAFKNHQSFFTASIKFSLPDGVSALPGSKADTEVLHGIHQRMKASLPSNAFLARRGDGYYLIALQLPGGSASVDRFIAKLLENMRAPMVVDRKEIALVVHVGHAMAPYQGHRWNVLVANADAALAEAMRAVDSSVQEFEPRMSLAPETHRAIENRVNEAVDNEEFSLAYQPRIRLSDNGVSGVEALLRWEGKETLSTVELLSVAESQGLGATLGEWVVRKACETAKRWSDLGYKIPISINVSRRQFEDSDFSTMVLETLVDTRCPSNLIELEIAESALFSDSGRSSFVASRLKQAGVRLLVDDFGKSGLNLVAAAGMPLDGMKIDQSFVTDMPDNPGKRVAVKSLIDVARNLGMTTIAEGVEDVRCLNALKALGCQEVQGFYFSKALYENELLNWYQGRRYTMA